MPEPPTPKPPTPDTRQPGRGRFITIEGGEGAGKSTQARRLEQALLAAGHRVLLTREPGGTRGAEALRGLLLSGEMGWSLPAETLLHFAARADHVEQVIRPALDDGVWVVSDRFADSTMVYQGYGQSGDRTAIAVLTELVGLRPDLTLVLDLPVELSLTRLAARPGTADRYERLGAPFFARIRDGFLAVAAAAAQRCAVIDATASEAAVAAAIWAALRARLP